MLGFNRDRVGKARKVRFGKRPSSLGSALPVDRNGR
jgi:hypothetical protein